MAGWVTNFHNYRDGDWSARAGRIIRPSLGVLQNSNRSELSLTILSMEGWTYAYRPVNALAGNSDERSSDWNSTSTSGEYPARHTVQWSIYFHSLSLCGASVLSLSSFQNRETGRKSVFWQKWLPIEVSQTWMRVDNTEMSVCVCENMQFISEQLFRAVQ